MLDRNVRVCSKDIDVSIYLYTRHGGDHSKKSNFENINFIQRVPGDVLKLGPPFLPRFKARPEIPDPPTRDLAFGGNAGLAAD